jgi:hypothetical protein
MRTGSKVAVFLSIAAVHIAIIVMSKRWVYRAPVIESRFSTWVVVDAPTGELPDERELLQLSNRQNAVTVSMPLIEIAASAEPIDDSGSSPDWREFGSQAIQNTIGKLGEEEGHRSLMSKPKTVEPPRDSSQPSIFKTPAFRAGDTQHFEDGEVLTWVSDHCYYTNRQIGSVLSSKSATKVCLLTPPILGGDGFPEEMKPRYLREPPSVPSASADKVALP